MRNFSTGVGFGRDVKLLIASMGIASLAGGFTQVVQPIYLAVIGIPPVLIGFTASVALIAGALRMVFFGVLSDKIGRRRIVFVMFMTSVVYNLIYSVAQDYSLFLLAAIIGGAGGEGLGGHIEGALLAEKAGDSRRTSAFSIQYFVSSSFSALGSFASGLPEVIVQSFGVQILDAVRLIFAFQAILVLMASILILSISEDSLTVPNQEERYLSKESQKKIAKLSVIGLFDGFGVGMIVSLFSLWFYLRFGVSIKTVGYIFTVSKVFETIAYLSASPISAKLGLIRTVSITRLGGAVSVALMAFMPTYLLAAVMFTMRNVIQHISIPLRQSYIMAIFNRSERASAASMSDLTRISGHAIASTLSGYIMENVNTTISPLISSVLVGVASQLYLLLFRNVKPPEERANT